MEYRSYWAIKKLNHDFRKAGEERRLFLNEMDEFRMKSYDSSSTYKERMKAYHDRMISPRELPLGGCSFVAQFDTFSIPRQIEV